MSIALNKMAWSGIGQIEIIGRLSEIGRVLGLPDAEILRASTNVQELNAFCDRYNQSRIWVVFGRADEMIGDRYRPGLSAKALNNSTSTKPDDAQ
jgi:hypothetical protein